LNPLYVAWSNEVAFQRKKPAAVGVKAAFLGFIESALATTVEKVPSGKRWLHEIKFDGYRVPVHLRNAAAKVFTRRSNDWTNRFKVAADARHISARVGDHRCGDGRPRCRWHHRFLGLAE
jgi:ATP-dependent DNA ligase